MKLFGSEKAMTQKAKVMPMADDSAMMAAKKRKAAEMAKRSGRQSTILTETEEKLGGKNV